MVGAEVVAHRVRLGSRRSTQAVRPRVVVGEGGGGADVARRLGAGAAAHGGDATEPRPRWIRATARLRFRRPTRILVAMSPEGLPPPPPPPPRDQRGPGRGLPGRPGHAEVGPVGPARASRCSIVRPRRACSSAPTTRRRSPTPTSWPRCGTARSRAIEVDNTNGVDHRRARRTATEFRTTGPLEGGLPDADLAVLRDKRRRGRVQDAPARLPHSACCRSCIPVAIFVGFFWFMQRRAQSQMGGIMSIGRSQAKTYSTERPGHDLRRRGRLRRA